MTLCPIAIVAGCKKCPAFSVCPLKSVIGDYVKQEEKQTKQQADNEEKYLTVTLSAIYDRTAVGSLEPVEFTTKEGIL